VAARALARRGQIGEAESRSEFSEEKTPVRSPASSCGVCPIEASPADTRGLEALKQWLEPAPAWLQRDSERAHGLPCQGGLAGGPQGTGKSLTAKAIAHAGGDLPLLRAGCVGVCRSGGAKRSAHRDMIRRAEAMAPWCSGSMRLTRAWGRQAAAIWGASQGCWPGLLPPAMGEKNHGGVRGGHGQRCGPTCRRELIAQGALRRDLSARSAPMRPSRRTILICSCAAAVRPIADLPGGAGGSHDGFFRRRTRADRGGGHLHLGFGPTGLFRSGPDPGLPAILFTRVANGHGEQMDALQAVGQASRPRQACLQVAGCNENRLPVTKPEHGVTKQAEIQWGRGVASLRCLQLPAHLGPSFRYHQLGCAFLRRGWPVRAWADQQTLRE